MGESINLLIICDATRKSSVVSLLIFYMNSSAHPIIYDTKRLKPAFVEEVLQVYAYRHLILQLIRRDILTRYKRSFLGVAWSMLNPLGMMIVLTIAFSTIFGQAGDYRVFLLSGLLAWGFFAESSSLIISQMIWGSSLIHQIYFPRTSFAIAAVGTGFVNLFLALIPLLLVMLVAGVPINASVLFTPISAVLILFFSLGVGLILSVAALFFADTNELFKVVLRAWMYLTPVIYPEQLLISRNYDWILKFNPMYFLIRVFRKPFENGTIPIWEEFLPALSISVLTFLLGWLLFTRFADEFSYRV